MPATPDPVPNTRDTTAVMPRAQATGASGQQALLLAGAMLALLLAGCRSAYRKEAEAFGEQLSSGDLPGAVALAREKFSEDGESRVLWALELASAQRLSGDIAGSIATFEQAESLLRDIDAQPEISLSREGLSAFSNPYQLTYRGRNLDRIFASAYQALACIESGELEKARVPMARTRFRIDDAKRLAAERAAIGRRESETLGSEDRQFQERLRNEQLEQAGADVRGQFKGLPTYANAMNPFALWLHGIYFLHTAEGPADLEMARKSLQAAAAVTQGNEPILDDLALAARGTGRPDPGADRTLVYIVHETGLAPRWSERSVTFPLILGDSRAPIVRVALPEIKPTAYRHAPLSPGVPGQPIRMSLLANVDAIVHDEFEEEYPIARNRAIASATLKATAAYLANRAAEERARRQPGSRGSQQADLAAKLATNLYNLQTPQADLRNWSSLPREIYLGRGIVKRGSQLRLEGAGVGGTASCPLPPAKAVVVTIRWIAPGMPAIIRTGVLQP